MNKHCKGCKQHHVAGHPKGSAHARVYNDWCSKYGQHAEKIIGHCKLQGGRRD
jgi:transcription elongation factor Elf1